MTDKILPCPTKGCTGTGKWQVRVGSIYFQMSCDVCGLSTGYCVSQEAALEAWNAIPRDVVFSSDTPTVPGWYWCTDVARTEGYPIVSHYDAWAIECVLPRLNDGEVRFLWAGPLRMPKEV